MGLILALLLFAVFWAGYALGRSDERLRALEEETFRRLDDLIARVNS